MTVENIEHPIEQAEAIEEKITEEQPLFAGKYQSVEELEKGYKELSTLVREKKPEAPEAYEFHFDNMPEDFSAGDDPLFQAMAPIMKEHNITQEQAAALAESFVQFQANSVPDAEHEINKLGPDAERIINRVEGFVNKNFSEDEATMINRMATTAEGVKLLHKMAALAGEKPVPGNSHIATESVNELRAKAEDMMKDPTLSSSPAKQQEYNRLWQRISRLEKGK